jgi:hypothetical protein
MGGGGRRGRGAADILLPPGDFVVVEQPGA